MPTARSLIDQGTMQADSAPALQDDEQDEQLNQQLVAYRSTQPFLTPAMQQFAEHWANNRNQIKAYQHAFPGSSVNAAKTHARRLFADGRIQAEILRVIDNWTDKSGTTIAQLEHELARLARSDARRLFGPGATLLDPHEWDADTAAAVASYSETPTKYGIVRKVRLHDKHAAARTLMEAKGAFEKQKAPPGAAAIFNINLGGVPIQLGAQIQPGRTIDMDVTRLGKAQKSPKSRGQRTGEPENAPNRVLAHPSAVSKSRQKTRKAAQKPVECAISTPEAPPPPPVSKPDLF
jgi:phage terminase small subunit